MDYTATIILRQRWTDERLVFEGSKNKSIALDARLVQLLWFPDTYIVDSKKSFLHDVTVENRLVRLFSNGTVLYAVRITSTVACYMDLSKYPMDKQTCKLQIESLGYNVKDLIFTWMRGNESVRGMDNLQLAQYTVEQFYTKIGIGTYETGNYPRLALYFVLKRNVIYFILETYIPSSLLVVVSWVSFWISSSSVPARTCFGVTTVLAMTTILMGSRSSFPTANCFIKAIDLYLGICFSFVFGALIEYAIAHYCSEQSSAANKKENKDPKEKPDEVNNTLLTNTEDTEISESKTESVPVQIEIDSSPQKENSVKFKFWKKMKEKMNDFIELFTVRNPENVDRYSRVIFPLVFMVINIFYWSYYLYFT
ncbi:gamma-aminobutyric acid receptor subunit pi isoform X2 [Bombina bombina]|nr:gamma-aminobutyric acid receptor subunit pi isoform X2 [Bombina bombina]